MNGIHSAPALGAGDTLGVKAAAGIVLAAGSPVADQAFDDVFRQLTGGLLMTSVVAGKAASPVAAAPAAAGADDAETDAALPVGAMAVPLTFALPAASAAPLVEPSGPGDILAGDEGTGAGITAARAEPSHPTTAGSAAPMRVTASGHAFSGAATVTAGEAVDDDLAPVDRPAEEAGTGTPPTEVEADARGLDGRRGMRETPARARTFDEPSPVPVQGEHGRTTARPAAADDGRQRAPVTAVGPAAATVAVTAPDTASRAAPQISLQSAAQTVPPAGSQATPQAAPRGLSETASEAPPQVPLDKAPAGAASQPLPANAERVFALQRALARQEGDERRGAPAAGLLTQAGREVVAAVTADGAGSGSERQGSNHRHGQAGPGTLPAVAPSAGPVTGTPSAVVGATDVASGAAPGMAMAADAATRFGPAAGAAWRAALASTSFTEALGPGAEAARTPGAPGFATALPALELPAPRGHGPLVETALPAPALDPTTAESVHSQIVKSIRLQWSGGLGEARVTLKPGYLGEVVASIKVEHGVVTATLQSDTPEVRRWMESHTASLREALVEHGLKLDRLTVAEPERPEAQGDRQAKPRQRQPDQHRPRARRQAADTDTPFDMPTE